MAHVVWYNCMAQSGRFYGTVHSANPDDAAVEQLGDAAATLPNRGSLTDRSYSARDNVDVTCGALTDRTAKVPNGGLKSAWPSQTWTQKQQPLSQPAHGRSKSLVVDGLVDESFAADVHESLRAAMTKIRSLEDLNQGLQLANQNLSTASKSQAQAYEQQLRELREQLRRLDDDAAADNTLYMRKVV